MISIFYRLQLYPSSSISNQQLWEASLLWDNHSKMHTSMQSHHTNMRRPHEVTAHVISILLRLLKRHRWNACLILQINISLGFDKEVYNIVFTIPTSYHQCSTLLIYNQDQESTILKELHTKTISEALKAHIFRSYK